MRCVDVLKHHARHTHSKAFQSRTRFKVHTLGSALPPPPPPVLPGTCWGVVMLAVMIARHVVNDREGESTRTAGGVNLHLSAKVSPAKQSKRVNTARQSILYCGDIETKPGVEWVSFFIFISSSLRCKGSAANAICRCLLNLNIPAAIPPWLWHICDIVPSAQQIPPKSPVRRRRRSEVMRLNLICLCDRM